MREIQQNDVVYITGNWFWAAILGKRLGKPVVSHLHDYFAVCPLSSLFHTTQSQVCDGCGILKGAVCMNRDDQIKRYAGYERAGHLIASLGFSRPINTSIINYIDQFIFVSESHQRLIASVASNVAKRGAVVYNPLPPVRYKKPASLGFAYLGGSFYEKGYRVLLSALSIYKPPHPFVATKCDANAIKLLGSFGVKAYPKVSWDDLERIQDSTHCLVFPSIWVEPFGVAFVEAMLSGKCVISSRLGAEMELAGNAEGVMYVEPNSPTQLAQAIQTVSSIPLENAVRLGQENRNRLLDFYHDKNPQEDLLSIFESLAKR
jgi:glycosyltransferase involved in cell wall biosynthesis